MPRSRPGPVQNARLSIPSLLGGVNRRPPSQRRVECAENLDNVLISQDRNASKRPPFEVVQTVTSTGIGAWSLSLSATGQYSNFVYHTLEFSKTERYLIAIDTTAVRTGTNKLFYVYWLDTESGLLYDHTPENQSANISTDVWQYVQHGPPSPKSDLKFASIGTDTLVLNKRVKAGLTSVIAGTVLENGSVAVGDRLFDLNGVEGGSADTEGKKITYLTSTLVDPKSEAVLWNPYQLYAAGTVVYVPVDFANGGTEEAGVYVSTVSVVTDIRPNAANATTWEYLRDVAQVPIETNKYPDPSRPWLGQSVPTFADIKFPPLTSDDTATYGDASAIAALTSLYGSAGGKIYQTDSPYLGNTSGYYQIINDTTQPYTRRVRTPDTGSVIDKRRMPMRLRYLGKNVSGISQWAWDTVKWDERVSGDSVTNPGPECFKDGKQSYITAMTFYDNRLWLAARDTLFSSEQGNYDNLFLVNADQTSPSDTIDQSLTWSKYLTTTDLLPFDSFLFVNTDGNVQFALQPTEGQPLGPGTCTVKPTSFYAADPLVSPLVLGSQIYFFAPRKLYMYLPSDTAINTSLEVSQEATGYLPSWAHIQTSVPNFDMVVVGDSATPNTLTCYINKYLGTQVTQSSFFKMTLSNDPVFEEAFPGTLPSIQSVFTFDGYLYVVMYRVTSNGSVASGTFVERCNLDITEIEYPLIDSRYEMRIDTVTLGDAVIDPLLPTSDPYYINAVYDADDNQTTFLFWGQWPQAEYVVLTGGFWGSEENACLPIVSTTYGSTPSPYSLVTIAGNYANHARMVTIGHPYVMNIEMSPQYYRDEQGRAIGGTLNLRTINVRHFETGDYDIFVYRRGRPSLTLTDIVSNLKAGTLGENLSHVTRFSASAVSNSLPTTLTQSSGNTQGRVLGYADVTTVHILSHYPTTCHISNIEINGVFRTKNTAHF